MIVSSRLLYVKTAAALARARRMGWLTDEAHTESVALLDRLWSDIDLTEVDEVVVTQAARLAGELGLRGYDAVHCASAEQLDDDHVVACGDQQLLDALATLDMATFDTNQPA